ncbi:MAG: hypothetical protein QG657_1167 [Acidobacteriota bacterium]|nr:hypothetical protein [Acidobacteriota bacterium]
MNNTNLPLLSIIVANYNYEDFIHECLDSILSQTYKNLEIVIFDDASTDSSPGIIRRYESQYPGIVKGIYDGEKNRGPALARHRAILASSGQYITTLDSDDYFIDAQKLEKEMAIVLDFKEKTGKDVIAFSNIVWVDRDKKRRGAWGNSETLIEGMIFKEILVRSHMIPRDYVMHKNLYYVAGGYDPRFTPYEDWDLKIRLAYRYEFYYSGVEGTAYRRHGKGLSSPPPHLHINWMRNVFQENIRMENDEVKREEITRQFEKFINEREKKYGC